MDDLPTTARAAEAMHRAARSGTGPVTEATITSMQHVLEGLSTDSSSCPDRDHARNRIACSDDHAQNRDREDRAGGRRDA